MTNIVEISLLCENLLLYLLTLALIQQVTPREPRHKMGDARMKFGIWAKVLSNHDMRGLYIYYMVT